MQSVKGKPPVILHFQPKDYRLFQTPAELKEWEKLMREEVGFRADISNLSGTCTECSCAGSTDDCDQD